MTYLREARRVLHWIAAVAISGSAFLAMPVQAATVTLGTGCTNGATYTGVTFDASGNVTLTCSGGGGGGAGTIAFNPTVSSVNVSQNVVVNVTRTGGSTGTASSSVTVSAGGCTVTPGSVSWADADSAAKPVTVTGTPGPTTCTLSGNAVTSAGSTTITGTVNVVDPNQPGAFALAAPQGSGPIINGPAVAITINRTGGTQGAYTIPYTATMTSLTGASIAEASPIAFAAGEATKTLTFTPGSTTGTLQLVLGAPSPVTTPPATASSATLLINVSNPGSGQCGTTPTNVVMLPDLPPEGQWINANLELGKIGVSKIPTLPAGMLGATVSQASSTYTSTVTRIEMSFSKCPGDIAGFSTSPAQSRLGGAYYPCKLDTSNINSNQLNWHLTVAQHYAFCYMPESDGPYYVNIRYEAPNCPYGTCGGTIQWNRR